MKYVKQLDTLRAISVILVIIQHWIPSTNKINTFPNGEIGVVTFFVLSGFLITNILFNARNNQVTESHSKWVVIKNFYIRRVLRIFPIYYLAVLILIIFGKYTLEDIKSASVYLLTYTQNYYFFKLQRWPGLLSHFWTLAVEEQFYLIWPFLILFINKRYLPLVIFFSIILSLCFQFILRNIAMSGVLTVEHFDSFGIGALMAWVICYQPKHSTLLYKGLLTFSLVGLLLLIGATFKVISFYIPIDFIISVISGWMILYIYLQHNHPRFRLNWFWSNRYLIFIGKISYGLYIYHNLLPRLLNYPIINVYINPYLPMLLRKQYFGWLFLVENLIVLFLAAWASYTLIEKPFLKFKRFFI